MSIIVVEGVDASGKSTLMENLRTVPGYFLLLRHSCRPLKSYDIARFLQFIENESSAMVRVVDRHPLISEPIYGPILRNENLVEKIYNPDQVVRRLERTVARIIYCRPAVARIKENLRNRPQLAGIETHIDELVKRYDDRMLSLANIVPIIHYDYDAPPADLSKLVFGG